MPVTTCAGTAAAADMEPRSGAAVAAEKEVATEATAAGAEPSAGAMSGTSDRMYIELRISCSWPCRSRLECN
eukprot:5322104-Lingulodinium_polyedra.AAC.1